MHSATAGFIARPNRNPSIPKLSRRYEAHPNVLCLPSSVDSFPTVQLATGLVPGCKSPAEEALRNLKHQTLIQMSAALEAEHELHSLLPR